MIALYELEFCSVEVHDDYVVSIMNEGVVVTPSFITQMSFIAEKHFENRLFVYISHRINSYVLNPISYFEVKKIDNLVALAVVSKDPRQKMQTTLEKEFFGKEFRQFSTIEDALKWKDEILKNQMKKIRKK